MVVCLFVFLVYHYRVFGEIKIYIGVDLAGILGGRMASVDGGLVPWDMGRVSPPQPTGETKGAS